MIRSGEYIRLTGKESDLLAALSGGDPSRIRTLTQLVTFVEMHMAHHGGPSPEERMIRALLADFLFKNTTIPR